MAQLCGNLQQGHVPLWDRPWFC